tara:strand:+ start:1858 stop:2373 length:516 start_codon:yes stop_codon:yes gene_type:complete
MRITERLLEIVTEETKTNITIKSRKRRAVESRALYCNVIKQLEPKQTLESIGEILNIDHSTVIHALNKYADYEKYNPDLKEQRKTVLKHFSILEEPKETNKETEIYTNEIQRLNKENETLTNEIESLKSFLNIEVIKKLDTLIKDKKGTQHSKLIIERLESFYAMNNKLNF